MVLDTKVNRRRFLKTAAAGLAAPYVLTSTALGGEGRPPASERITVVCIGVKNRGGNHMSGVLGAQDAQLVGICDVDDQVRAKAVKRVADRYGKPCRHGRDFRDFIARDDIDAVTIGTPDHSHALLSIEACKHGKDVFVEKPMTLTIAEGQAMVKAVRRYGRVLQVGSGRRSIDSTAREVELVRNGRIGKVRRVEVSIKTRSGKNAPFEVQPVPDHLDYDLWLGPAPWTAYDPRRVHYNFRFVTDFSGGDVTNWGAHYLDVAQWGLGMDHAGPIAVEGRGKHYHGIHDCFFDIDVHYQYPGDIDLHLKSGGNHYKWIGTEGSVPGKVADDKIGPDDIQVRRAQGGHFGDWLHCIKTREDPTAPVEAGHRSATVCHLANIAMRLERPLKWDPVKEEFPGDDEANRMRHRPYRAPWMLKV